MNRLNELKLKAILFATQHNITPERATAFAKANWMNIASFIVLLYIMEDVDDAAEASHMSAVLDIMTAQSEGVIS